MVVRRQTPQAPAAGITRVIDLDNDGKDPPPLP